MTVSVSSISEYVTFLVLLATRKELRKRISKGEKSITLQHLSEFMGTDSFSTEETETKLEQDVSSISSSAVATNLFCPIPADVPHLPQPFHPRDGPLKNLIAALIQEGNAPAVSLTAPKSKSKQGRTKIVSQGMVCH